MDSKKLEFLRKVPTAQIDQAIDLCRSSGKRFVVQLYVYPPLPPISEPVNMYDAAVTTECFTLPDLYREIAYREDMGAARLREVLREFEHPNE